MTRPPSIVVATDVLTTTTRSAAASATAANAVNNNTKCCDRTKHVEVVVRIRPLTVAKESSSSFFDVTRCDSTSTSATLSSNHSFSPPKSPTSPTTASGIPKTARLTSRNASKLRKPPVPRGTLSVSGISSPVNSSSTAATVASSSNLARPTASSNYGTNSRVTNNNNNGPASSYISTTWADSQQLQQAYCAWDVISPDTVKQSDKTDIIPGRTHHYTLDRVFGPETTTQNLYDTSVKGLVQAAMDGYHTAVLAYGQTSTGKTHTMSGTSQQPGLIPLAVQECFRYLNNQQQPREYLLRVSYLEVYKEHIRDLLVPTSATAPPVRLFDSADGLVVKGLREEVVTQADQVFRYLAQGEARRQVGATHLNQHSSRSHVMVRLWIESRGIQSTNHNNNNPASSSGTVSSVNSLSSDGRGVRVSSLSLVDLAGSESVRLTGSNERREEGHYINKSLMTLGQVVYALSELMGDSPNNNNNNNNSAMRRHVPYRDSKLTRLLQPSLSGNAQVVLICCISPMVSHVEESHNTFKFAVRAKKIPQKATITEGSDEKTLLASYREEIEDLKMQLKEAREQQERLMKVGLSRQSSPSFVSSSDYIQEDEIEELVSAIQNMERLILKTKPLAPQFPEDLLDATENDYDYDHQSDEEDLMALATIDLYHNTSNNNNTSAVSNNTTTTPRANLRIATTTSPPTNGNDDDNNNNNNNSNSKNNGGSNGYYSSDNSFTDNRDLRKELQRVQGLLRSVMKKRSGSGSGGLRSSLSPMANAVSEEEVRNLRAQLEEQEVATSLRKADSSFLQTQLEGKDKLLQEISKLLEAVEERQSKLEQENASLRNQVAALKASSSR